MGLQLTDSSPAPKKAGEVFIYTSPVPIEAGKIFIDIDEEVCRPIGLHFSSGVSEEVFIHFSRAGEVFMYTGEEFIYTAGEVFIHFSGAGDVFIYALHSDCIILRL